MQRNVLVSLILLVLSISGCGGGGGGGGTSTVVVSGMASKGPFVSGIVNVYDVSGGTSNEQRKLIQSGIINSDGTYSINISPSDNPVMVEIPPGLNVKYIDEADNRAQKPLNIPLRAIVPSVAANTPIAVTPFTELAVREAGTTPTKTDIQNANALISALYQLPNIISTLPVDASANIPTGTDPNRINYGLALAAVSQMISTGSTSLENTLNNLQVQNDDSVANTASTAFRTAVETYLSGNPPVQAHVPSLAESVFRNAGTVVTTSVQTDKQNPIADGQDAVTVTASFSASLPDDTAITFTITSGAARFSNGQTTFTSSTTGNIATAVVTSDTAGASEITATYVPGSTGSVSVTFLPTLVLQVSKSAAQSSGTDIITLTATPSAVAAGFDSVAFAVTGAATFDNNTNNKSVNLNNGVAAVALKSNAVGTVTVTATYAVSSTASVNVRFAQPVSAVLDVGYNRSFNSVSSFGFRIKNLPAGSISGAPTHTLLNINESLFDGSGANTNTIFTVLYVRSSTLAPGFSIAANVPVARLTYTIPAGQYPQFTLTLEDVNNTTLTPLLLIDPDDFSRTVFPNPGISVSDYFMNVTYKDASGNPL